MSARVLDQTCFLMMAGYWGPFFSEFLWTSHLSWSIRTLKRIWPILSHLVKQGIQFDQTSLVKGLVYCMMTKRAISLCDQCWKCWKS